MKKPKEKISPVSYFFTILAILCLIPSMAFSQSRGIKVVAVDKATKEWKEIPLYNKTYAVIIGIDNYPNLSPEFQLSYAVSDAKAIERILRSKFLFNKIYTLYNEQATKSNILDLLLNKLSQISKDDAVFVFFAGHGGQEQTDFGPMGFIVPQDGNFSDMRKVISMSTIRDDISKRIRAKHVFYTMDSCYSGILVTKRGATSKRTRRDIAYLQQITKEPVRQVLTAGSANQEVLDGGPGGHSVFAGRFLEILDEADDFITANEISTLVKERVFSDAQARGHVQTPKSGELFGLGDFIFMPSMTKKLGNIENQVSELEKELLQIKEAEIRAKKYQNKVAQREAERKRKIAEAKLQAKKLEEQRLKQKKELHEKREQERRKRLAEQNRKEKEETARLAALQREVALKRKNYKTSMITSLDDALNEMQTLDKEIISIRTRFIDDLKKRILGIAKSHSESQQDIILEKDEFETETEYQARVKKISYSSQNTNQNAFNNAMDVVNVAFREQITPLINQMKEISSNTYTVYGHDALQIKLGKYNADKESFKITIASKNITRPLYSQGRFLFVSKSRRQAKNVGIKQGDMIVKYNHIMVPPNVNWDRLKQTVISDNVLMEVDRNGKLLKFTLKKGTIGIDTFVDDYLNDLVPGQFVIHGELHVPRQMARRFKQNYLNGFITAELKVKPASPFISFVAVANVIDESNDKKFDLLNSGFLNMGHRLIYDSKKQIFLMTKIHNMTLTWFGASQYAKRFSHLGFDWRLPHLEELKSLYQTLAFSYFNFPNDEFHTSAKLGKHDNQYNPTENNTDKENLHETESVLFVTTGEFKQEMYDLFNKRYLELDNRIVFDTKTKLIWFNSPITNKKMTWIEANKFVKRFSFNRLKGWRLPRNDEFKLLYDPTIRRINKIFHFPDDEFHTAPITGEYDYQYNPIKNNTDREKINETESVIAVM